MTIDSSTRPHPSPAAADARAAASSAAASTSPATPATTPPRLPWNVAVDQRPAAVALPRTAAEVATVVRVAAEAGLRVAPQSTGHNAGPARRPGPRRRRHRPHLGDEHRDRRPGPRHRPRRGRRRLGARRRRRRRPRPGRPARLLPRRRHRRLLARRRHRLVRPQARPRHQQPHRGRARHRRRHAGPRRRRRRTPSCSGRCAAAAAASASSPRSSSGCYRHPDGVRRHADVGPRGHRAGAARVGRLGADRPRRGHHVLPRHAAPADARPARRSSAAGRLVVIDGAVLGSDERGAELLAGPARAAPELDTFARTPAKSLVRLHMDPEGGAPFVSDSAMLGSLPATPRSTRSSPRSARTPRPRC